MNKKNPLRFSKGFHSGMVTLRVYRKAFNVSR